MKLYRRYIRYFVIGFILTALAFGSIGIKVIYSDTSPETMQSKGVSSAAPEKIASPSECQPTDACCPKPIERTLTDALK